MKQEIIDRYQAEASVFSALAHPTRLFVLHQINNASHSVTELAQMAGIDISTMSKHLDLLEGSLSFYPFRRPSQKPGITARSILGEWQPS